jgi:leader peptidase (prepilin peptidase)/N-methyltransferase
MLEFLSIPGVAIALAALLGLLVGSFLNVVILRLPERMLHGLRAESREILELPGNDAEPAPPGIVREASHCPQCKHKLGLLENIPLLSWLALRGRCKHCGAAISVQYPLVELLTCLCSIVIVWKFGIGLHALAGLFFTWALIALSGIDVRTQLLPDQITLPLLWAGLLLSLSLNFPWIDASTVTTHPLFVDSAAAILGAAFGYLSLWLVYWGFKLATGKEGMGYGDFKLLAALGAWMGPSALLPIVLLSSLIGALVGGTLLAVQGRDRATPIPFGPYLAAAGWTWSVAGPWLGALYDAMLPIR